MNWYKIAKINIAEKQATYLTNLIFSKIKEGDWAQELYDGTDFSDIPGIEIVSFVLYENSNIDRIPAAYIESEKKIGLNINIEGKLTPDKYSWLVHELQSSLRHELEHVSDKNIHDVEYPYMYLGQAGFNNIDALLRYYTHPSEIRSHVASLYYAAKKTKQPFIKLLDDKLMDISLYLKARFPELSEEEVIKTINQIKTAWLDYAKQRYPQAQLTL